MILRVHILLLSALLSLYSSASSDGKIGEDIYLADCVHELISASEPDSLFPSNLGQTKMWAKSMGLDPEHTKLLNQYFDEISRERGTFRGRTKLHMKMLRLMEALIVKKWEEIIKLLPEGSPVPKDADERLVFLKELEGFKEAEEMLTNRIRYAFLLVGHLERAFSEESRDRRSEIDLSKFASEFGKLAVRIAAHWLLYLKEPHEVKEVDSNHLVLKILPKEGSAAEKIRSGLMGKHLIAQEPWNGTFIYDPQTLIEWRKDYLLHREALFVNSMFLLHLRDPFLATAELRDVVTQLYEPEKLTSENPPLFLGSYRARGGAGEGMVTHAFFNEAGARLKSLAEAANLLAGEGPTPERMLLFFKFKSNAQYLLELANLFKDKWLKALGDVGISGEDAEVVDSDPLRVVYRGKARTSTGAVWAIEFNLRETKETGKFVVSTIRIGNQCFEVPLLGREREDWVAAFWTLLEHRVQRSGEEETENIRKARHYLLLSSTMRVYVLGQFMQSLRPALGFVRDMTWPEAQAAKKFDFEHVRHVLDNVETGKFFSEWHKDPDLSAYVGKFERTAFVWPPDTGQVWEPLPQEADTMKLHLLTSASAIDMVNSEEQNRNIETPPLFLEFLSVEDFRRFQEEFGESPLRAHQSIQQAMLKLRDRVKNAEKKLFSRLDSQIPNPGKLQAAARFALGNPDEEGALQLIDFTEDQLNEIGELELELRRVYTSYLRFLDLLEEFYAGVIVAGMTHVPGEIQSFWQKAYAPVLRAHYTERGIAHRMIRMGSNEYLELLPDGKPSQRVSELVASDVVPTITLARMRHLLALHAGDRPGHPPLRFLHGIYEQHLGTVSQYGIRYVEELNAIVLRPTDTLITRLGTAHALENALDFARLVRERKNSPLLSVAEYKTEFPQGAISASHTRANAEVLNLFLDTSLNATLVARNGFRENGPAFVQSLSLAQEVHQSAQRAVNAILESRTFGTFNLVVSKDPQGNDQCEVSTLSTEPRASITIKKGRGFLSSYLQVTAESQDSQSLLMSIFPPQDSASLAALKRLFDPHAPLDQEMIDLVGTIAQVFSEQVEELKKTYFQWQTDIDALIDLEKEAASDEEFFERLRGEAIHLEIPEWRSRKRSGKVATDSYLEEKEETVELWERLREQIVQLRNARDKQKNAEVLSDKELQAHVEGLLTQGPSPDKLLDAMTAPLLGSGSSVDPSVARDRVIKLAVSFILKPQHRPSDRSRMLLSLLSDVSEGTYRQLGRHLAQALTSKNEFMVAQTLKEMGMENDAVKRLAEILLDHAKDLRLRGICYAVLLPEREEFEEGFQKFLIEVGLQRNRTNSELIKFLVEAISPRLNPYLIELLHNGEEPAYEGISLLLRFNATDEELGMIAERAVLADNWGSQLALMEFVLDQRFSLQSPAGRTLLQFAMEGNPQMRLLLISQWARQDADIFVDLLSQIENSSKFNDPYARELVYQAIAQGIGQEGEMALLNRWSVLSSKEACGKLAQFARSHEFGPLRNFSHLALTKAAHIPSDALDLAVGLLDDPRLSREEQAEFQKERLWKLPPLTIVEALILGEEPVKEAAAEIYLSMAPRELAHFHVKIQQVREMREELQEVLESPDVSTHVIAAVTGLCDVLQMPIAFLKDTDTDGVTTPGENSEETSVQPAEEPPAETSAKIEESRGPPAIDDEIPAEQESPSTPPAPKVRNGNGSKPIAPENIVTRHFSVAENGGDQRRVRTAPQVQRRGQQRFRMNILGAYGSRCAVTDLPVVELLQAPHIIPYLGDATDDVTNGICMRQEMHELFDRCLLRIDSDTLEIRFSDAVKEQTEEFDRYEGRTLHVPEDQRLRPNHEALFFRAVAFDVVEYFHKNACLPEQDSELGKKISQCLETNPAAFVKILGKQKEVADALAATSRVHVVSRRQATVALPVEENPNIQPSKLTERLSERESDESRDWWEKVLGQRFAMSAKAPWSALVELSARNKKSFALPPDRLARLSKGQAEDFHRFAAELQRSEVVVYLYMDEAIEEDLASMDLVESYRLPVAYQSGSSHIWFAGQCLELHVGTTKSAQHLPRDGRVLKLNTHEKVWIEAELASREQAHELLRRYLDVSLEEVSEEPLDEWKTVLQKKVWTVEDFKAVLIRRSLAYLLEVSERDPDRFDEEFIRVRNTWVQTPEQLLHTDFIKIGIPSVTGQSPGVLKASDFLY